MRLRAAALVLLLAVPPLHAAAGCGAWPQWERFAQNYVSDSGRVIDVGSADARTVSEGQAYALFFALVANDRPRFERLLRWTENNLAAGDLASRLPAWLWGRAADGRWGVLDANPASDADVWIAYTLGEAGRLWQSRPLRVLGAVLGERILREETADIPGLGRSLLPAPVGFRIGEDRWRLNPSYVPPQLLRGLHQQQPQAGWDALLAPSLRLLTESAPRGLAPDWVIYRNTRGFEPDPETEGHGDYDAIRVYLWAGLMDADDAARRDLLKHLQPMAALTRSRGAPPEQVDSRDGSAGERDGNAGFSAALLPFLRALGDEASLNTQRARVQADPPAARGDAYYQNVLALFGQGADENRYRFDADGRLHPAWSHTCAP